MKKARPQSLRTEALPVEGRLPDSLCRLRQLRARVGYANAGNPGKPPELRSGSTEPGFQNFPA